MTEISIAALSVLIVLSAFFSGSETALVAANRVKLNHLAANGATGAKRALELLRRPSKLLAVILVGNNLVNVMATALATTLLGPVYATVVITLVLLVFAEITPKSLAVVKAEPFASAVAFPVQVFGVFFRPIVWLTSGVTEFLLWPFLRGKKRQATSLSRQELLTAIKLGARDGELEPSETRMAEEVLLLKDKPINRIMIPVEEVDTISESSRLVEVMEEFRRTGNTRYPVYRGEVTEMIGVLLVKDLILHHEGMEENWLQYVRPLMRCRDSLEADEVLRDMQIQRSHLAAVENDDEEIIGIVTMEDILEEIVGEILDEHDADVELIQEYSPGRYVVRGDAEVDDMCKVINVDLGQRDQQGTLSEWFEKRAPKTTSKNRRVKVGSTRVIHKGKNRFEIWMKGRTE
jgi:CBS domain containing-hemolysin-like protein